MIAYAEKVASEYESEPQEERFEILMTSDAFPDPEDVYAIWDNIREKYYADDYGKILTYPTEEAANEGLAAVKKAVADKGTEEWLYVERAKQGLDPVPTQDNADLIGKEITIDNRKYVVESVGRISGEAFWNRQKPNYRPKKRRTLQPLYLLTVTISALPMTRSA